MLVALLHFLLQLSFLVQEFLLHLKQFFLFEHFSLLTGGINHLIEFSLQYVTENHVSAKASYDKGGHGYDNK